MKSKEKTEKIAVYETGAVRDSGEGKPAYNHIALDIWEWLGKGSFGEFRTIVLPLLEELEETDEDFIPPYAKARFQAWMEKNARKYGKGNWQRGIPLDRYFNSAIRHLLQWRFGDSSEGHLEAVMFNAMAAMETERLIAKGEVPKSFVRNVGVLMYEFYDDKDQDDDLR